MTQQESQKKKKKTTPPPPKPTDQMKGNPISINPKKIWSLPLNSLRKKSLQQISLIQILILFTIFQILNEIQLLS